MKLNTLYCLHLKTSFPFSGAALCVESCRQLGIRERFLVQPGILHHWTLFFWVVIHRTYSQKVLIPELKEKTRNAVQVVS